jgi:beta-lactamase class D
MSSSRSSALRFVRKICGTGAALLAIPTAANARTLCTIVTEATSGAVIFEQGDCRTRVTPASTFKIALSVMGFDADFLRDAHDPQLPYREGYVDWGGADWKQPTDPTRWLKYSVVWYSQIITHALGAQQFRDYVARLGYGNADVSGDPGENNGLDRAWLASSLKISPFEQTIFLSKLLARRPPASEYAMEETSRIIESRPASGGWTMHGKTGAAFPRKPDGSFDFEHGYGWYVGWAVNGRTLVFARLDQDERQEAVTAGLRARDALIEEWSTLAASGAR